MKTILVIAAALFAIMLGDCAHADQVYRNGQWVELTKDTYECDQWCKPYWKSMPKSEYVFDLALAADMFTTLDIKNHPDIEETNIILGKHPSDGKIIAYTLGAALIHSAITYELVDGGAPKSLIRAWEYISIGVETGYAYHNIRLGLHFAL